MSFFPDKVALVLVRLIRRYLTLGAASQCSERGEAVKGVALKRLTVHLEWDYAYQWFPALLNVQTPTVFLREKGYRPLSSKVCFSLFTFHGHENSPGTPRERQSHGLSTLALKRKRLYTFKVAVIISNNIVAVIISNNLVVIVISNNLIVSLY